MAGSAQRLRNAFWGKQIYPVRGDIENSGDSADIQTPWLEAIPLAVEPASVPKPLFWFSLPLGRVLSSLELFHVLPSLPWRRE